MSQLNALDPASPPVFDETIGGALIDAARINVMAARMAFPEDGAVIECLEHAARCLDIARMSTQRFTTPPTSIHVVGGAGGGR